MVTSREGNTSRSTMKIEQHIREILRHHAFVAIPGVGSFCLTYSPAKICEEQNRIFPPSYTYTFDANRTFDDSAIANYLTAKYGINMQKAQQRAEEWVSTVEARLAMGESVAFDGIGELCTSGENTEFFPYADDRKASAAFGLSPVPIPPPIKNAKRKKNRKKRRNAVLIPLFILLLGGGGYAAYYYLDWPYIASRMPWNNVEKQPFASSTRPSTEKNIAITTPPRTIDTTAESPKTQRALDLVDSSLHQHNALQPVENNTLYYIVAGSFRSEENAQKQIKDLRNLGFKDPKIRRESEYYQVYVAYYSSLPHAQAKLNELWQKYGESFCFLNKVTK